MDPKDEYCKVPYLSCMYQISLLLVMDHESEKITILYGKMNFVL